MAKLAGPALTAGGSQAPLAARPAWRPVGDHRRQARSMIVAAGASHHFESRARAPVHFCSFVSSRGLVFLRISAVESRARVLCIAFESRARVLCTLSCTSRSERCIALLELLVAKPLMRLT